MNHVFFTFALIASFTQFLAPHKTYAGDRDWATAGKILTGVVAADILVNHLPAWQQQRQSNSANSFRIVKDPPPPPFYAIPRYDETYNYETAPQPVVIPARPREEIPPQIAAGSPVVAEKEEPAVIHQLNPVKRIYQPRIQGHQAYVQERVSPNHPWITVEKYPSIW